ncbi:HBL/NHE enterotoxin family protein [Longirhabdus pacifica]|uniref:HBL/NHE enterotoxin family protein n=1 Tax=Longirhabdus pacifica TaxID=2305227 RepID=UPI0013E8B9C8|nr:HBL/NHE enterotoxin family protein [Longirhabdus pacifica]
MSISSSDDYENIENQHIANFMETEDVKSALENLHVHVQEMEKFAPIFKGYKGMYTTMNNEVGNRLSMHAQSVMDHADHWDKSLKSSVVRTSNDITVHATSFIEQYSEIVNHVNNEDWDAVIKQLDTFKQDANTNKQEIDNLIPHLNDFRSMLSQDIRSFESDLRDVTAIVNAEIASLDIEISVINTEIARLHKEIEITPGEHLDVIRLLKAYILDYEQQLEDKKNERLKKEQMKNSVATMSTHVSDFKSTLEKASDSLEPIINHWLIVTAKFQTLSEEISKVNLDVKEYALHQLKTVHDNWKDIDQFRKRLIVDIPDQPLLFAFYAPATQFVYNDKGTGSHQDGTVWRTPPIEGFKSVGDYAQGNYDLSTGKVIVLASNDKPNTQNPVLKDPTDYELIWADHKSDGDMDGSFWKPLCSQGYTSLGHVATPNYNKPNTTQVTCVRQDFVAETSIGDLIWSDKGSGARTDVSLFMMNSETNILSSGSFHAQPQYDFIVGQAFGLKMGTFHILH